MRSFFIAIFLFGYSVCFAQQTIYAGAEISGNGNTALYSKNVWAVFHNMSQLVHLEKAFVGISSMLKFQQQGFQSVQLASTFYLKNNIVGVGFHRFGDAIYNEQLICLAFAHQIGKINIGLRTNLIQHYIQEFESHLNYRLDVSLSFPFNPTFEAQLLLKNFTFNTLKNQIQQSITDDINTALLLGIGFFPHSNIKVQTQLRYQTYEEIFFHFGSEFQLIENFKLRVGYTNKPSQFHGGCSFQLKKIDVSYAIVRHPFLKMSHQLSLSSSLSKLPF